MTRCGSIRPWIARSVDGELEPAEALRLARHLATCTACRITLARESRLAEMLGHVDDAFTVDESFFGAVMASLPERPVRPAIEVSRRARWRRGLRLAAFGALGVLGAGLAARVLPSLHLDVATPGMPRFTPDDADGWISLIGSAAQWIRVTAQSITWAGSSGAWSASTIGAVWLVAALAGVGTLLALSGALAWATRNSSRAS
jgi:anti-sigma factor RsiW